ncbi:hypothetical protein MTP03_15560 [Tsukamurella sp. PLM1]|nr:hypothetical protein MTP03_15560 [Tsukamurella sp. PLM1]
MLPTGLEQPAEHGPGELGRRPQGGRDRDRAVPGLRDLPRQVVAHVEAAGQERGHHDGGLAIEPCQHLTGRGAEDVDEGHPHPLVQARGHRGGEITDHRHAVFAAGAVRDQERTHSCTSSTARR